MRLYRGRTMPFSLLVRVRKTCMTRSRSPSQALLGSCCPACIFWRAGFTFAVRAAAVTCSIPANLQHRRPGKSMSAFHQSGLCLRCSSRLKDIFKWDLNVNSSASRAFTMRMKGRTKLTRELVTNLELGAC